MNITKAKLLLSIAAAGVFSLGQARADLASTYLWDGGQSYGLFTLGSSDGGALMGDSSFTGSTMYGAIGIGTGNQTFDTGTQSTFNGNIYYAPGSTVTGTPGFTGSYSKIQSTTPLMTQQESNIATGFSTLSSEPNSYAGVTSTVTATGAPSTAGANGFGFNASTGKPTGSMILSGTADNITLTNPGIAAVFNLSAMTLAGTTLTLSGSGSYVFNISGAFTLSSKSSIVLTGSITAGNVVFDLEGTSPAINYNPSLTAAQNVANGYYTLQGASTLNGTIVAPDRSVAIISTVTGTPGPSTVNGAVIADNVIVENSTINQQPASQ